MAWLDYMIWDDLGTWSDTEVFADITQESVDMVGAAPVVTFTSNKYMGGGQVGIFIDGGTSTPTTGYKGYCHVPYQGNVTGWRILGDDTGSIEVDIWKCPFADYPPTVADTICGGTYPSVTASVTGEGSDLSDWTTTFADGEIFGFNIISISTFKKITIVLTISKS